MFTCRTKGKVCSTMKRWTAAVFAVLAVLGGYIASAQAESMEGCLTLVGTAVRPVEPGKLRVVKGLDPDSVWTSVCDSIPHPPCYVFPYPSGCFECVTLAVGWEGGELYQDIMFKFPNQEILTYSNIFMGNLSSGDYWLIVWFEYEDLSRPREDVDWAARVGEFGRVGVPWSEPPDAFGIIDLSQRFGDF